MKHEMTIEHHDGHTYTGDDGTQSLDLRDRLRVAIDQCKEQHREQRTGTDDQGGVRGRGVEHRRVFREEIDGAARKAENNHQEFVFPGSAEPVERGYPTPNPSS